MMNSAKVGVQKAKIENDFKNWVYRVSRWIVLDYIGQGRVGDPPGGKVSIESEVIPDSGQSPGENVHKQRLRKFLQDILHTELTSLEREILLLKYWEGRTYKEIAMIIFYDELKVVPAEEFRTELNKKRQIVSKDCQRARDKIREPVKQLLAELRANNPQWDGADGAVDL